VLYGANQEITIPQSGIYDATVNLTTDLGCSAEVALENLITIYPSPEADFVLNQDVFTYYDNLLRVVNSSSNNVVSWDYRISDGYNAHVPSFGHYLSAPGVYEVSLLVTDNHGCKDSTSKNIDFAEGILVYIPNAITPDADGINDVFLPSIFGDALKTYHLLIFDRWGTVIFESFDRDKVWQGDVREDGYYAIPDAYNYILKITTVNDEEKKYQGHVVLVR
jgi:gliding motility-associated-like protein